MILRSLWGNIKFAALLFLLTGISFAIEPIRYELGFQRPNTHLLNISIRAGELDGESVQFALPYWAPGVYIAEEFATNVQGFAATDDEGKPLSWHKVEDGQTWQIDLQGATSIVVHYQIYANGMPIRGAQYNEHHASLTGAAVWMYMVHGKDRPAELTIDRTALPSTWKIATGMDRKDSSRFAAQNYDWFADCPIEISDYTVKEFSALGTTYHVVVHDELNQKDFTKFVEDLHKVVEKGIVPILAPAVGGPLAAPFPEFWFLIHVSGFGGVGAGVEHLNSTMIVMSSDWDDHSSTNHDFLTDLYTYKIDLATHEFFHAWNVKRLRPKPLGPFDYSRPVHTPSLWISEGLTNYFSSLALLRAGFWTPQNYLDHTARVITGLEEEPGRKERSIADTSWDTWFGFAGGGAGGFGPNLSNNLDNTNYSYYDGGQMLGLLLDLEIRQATSNKKSLDDWLRLMYQRYALPKPGFDPEDAVQAVSEVAGHDMSDFFRRYVDGKEPLPYETDFAFAGIQVEKEYSKTGWLGARVQADHDGRALISNVIPQSPAENDGLDRGDVIIAVNNKAVDAKSFEKIGKDGKPGDSVTFSIIRLGELHSMMVTLGENPNPTFKLEPMEKLNESQARIYHSLMNLP